MYRILVVDDDRTSLIVAEACLKRWNYQVTAVSHPLEALSILERRDENEKSYDVVLSDVHMPDMDGFKLMRRVNKEFNLPVVLISADDRIETVRRGLISGAPSYLLKPITTDQTRNLWQYSVLWKNREKYAYQRAIQANIPRSIPWSSAATYTADEPREMKSKPIVWTPNLHTRFVECILILGPRDAVPKNILEKMDVSSLTREQVASHLQKFRRYLQTILDGKTTLDESPKRWIDYNYYSSVVGGNPNKILINQLLEQRRTGKWADPIQASHPLPPYNEAEASLSMSTSNAMLMPNDYAFSSDNVATPTQGPGCVPFQGTVTVAGPVVGLGGTPFQSAGNLNMENISTYINHIQHLNYKANHDQPGYYDQNPLNMETMSTYINRIQHLNYKANHDQPGSYDQNPATTPIFDDLGSQQPSTGGLQDMQTAEMTQQLGSLQIDPNIDTSFGEMEFENADPMQTNEEARIGEDWQGLLNLDVEELYDIEEDP
ncbi:hypothetical protein ACET3Z_014875 [Daucus carota]